MENGRKNKGGNFNWDGAKVKSILTNEKMAGDVLLGKWWTPDYITHKPEKNTGQKRQYFFENRVPPIIDKDTFNRAQEILKSRSPKNNDGRYSNVHPLSSKIRCSKCGKFFHSVYAGRNQKQGWRCGTRRVNGAKRVLDSGAVIGCEMSSCFQNVFMMNMLSCLFQHLIEDKEKIRQTAISNVLKLLKGVETADEKSKRIEMKVASIEAQRTKAIELCCDGTITEDDLKRVISKLDTDLADAKETLSKMDNIDATDKPDKLRELALKRVDEILSFNAFDETVCRTMIEVIEVIDKDHFKIVIKDIVGGSSTFNTLSRVDKPKFTLSSIIGGLKTTFLSSRTICMAFLSTCALVHTQKYTALKPPLNDWLAVENTVFRSTYKLDRLEFMTPQSHKSGQCPTIYLDVRIEI